MIFMRLPSLCKDTLDYIGHVDTAGATTLRIEV